MRRSRIVTCLTALGCSLLVAAPAGAANPVPPKATTGTASAVGQTVATVAGTVDPQGAATTFVFEYGTTSAYGLTTPAQDAGDGADPVAAQASLSKLTSDTTYHFRLVATNAAGLSRGSDHSFRTAKVPHAPTVTTGRATSITAASATLTATVDPRGPQTTVYAEYGPSTTYGARGADVVLSPGFGSRAITFPIAGLTSYTTYHYRIVATNEKGTTRGTDRTVVTLRAPTSVVLTAPPTAVGWGGTATIAGRVSGQGIGRIGLSVERTDFPFTAAASKKSITAGSDGSFHTTVGPLWVTSRVRVVTRTTIVAVSPTATVGNRLRAGIRAVDKTRRQVTLRGTVQPASANAYVSVQRRSRSGGRWVRVGRVTATPANASTSRYRLRVLRPRHGGTYRAVAVAQDGGAHVPGTTRTLRVGKRR